MADYSMASRAKRLNAEAEAKAVLDAMPLAFAVSMFLSDTPRTTAWRRLKRLEKMGLVIKIKHGLWQKRI